MTFAQRMRAGFAAVLVLAAVAAPSSADTITANCTGMFELDIYKFDTTKAEQDVDGIGASEFEMDASEIRLRGAFGEYRFDLNAGTLYHTDSDTGVYCTYRTES